VKKAEKGYLIIIGGAEDKKGDSSILKEAASMLSPGGRLTILTTATEYPDEAGAEYRSVFARLGVQAIDVLDIRTRDDANSDTSASLIDGTCCVFFTGGDQLRITSILGGTRVNEALKRLYLSGGIITGTSAGASAMSETMVVQGDDNEPARKCTLKMAPGLGLLDQCIIDQHFDQRGRFGRLLCGVAENPDTLGIGIDENTAVKVFPDGHFEVLGANAVTVIDGKTIKSSNVAELKQNELLMITGVTVHILPAGYGFNRAKREVMRLKQDNDKQET
jgi:cyanophycinase